MKSILLQIPLFYLGAVALAANLTLVKEYAGTDFFNEWDYYGNYDDKTHGGFYPTPLDNIDTETELAPHKAL